jgi:hypothetical protein
MRSFLSLGFAGLWLVHCSGVSSAPIPSPSPGDDDAGGSSSSGGPIVGTCDPKNCPGLDSTCGVRACIDNRCGVRNLRSGTVVETQNAGDCVRLQCDGNGGTINVPDDADLPDDKNPCTLDRCNLGKREYTNASAGAKCGGNTLVCDGRGNCVGCNAASECPGTDSECRTRTCVGGTCGNSFGAKGKLTSAQTSADCKKMQCDGAGNIENVADDLDLPIDNKQCTNDVCLTGVASNPPKPLASSCAQNGGKLCNATGLCVECNVAADCPGADSFCAKRTCLANTCGFDFTAQGTPTPIQIPGDCQRMVCDGAGAEEMMPDNGDVFVDGKQCTRDQCVNGRPRNPPQPAGTACTQGGVQCDGNGSCVFP